MADHPFSFTALVVLVVIAVVGGGVGAGLLYRMNTAPPLAGPRTVQVGDNITVDYIGMFGSGPQQGRVFDTSIASVADDNSTYPKSLEYTPRNNTTNYTALPVHVGPNTPSGGYNISNLSFGGVVTGFWKGLVGLSVNETRWITVPPSEGYGSLNASCLRHAPLTFTIPVLVTYTPSTFSKTYPNATGAAGVSFPDPSYHWTDLVLSANASAIVVERLATVGWSASPSGWPIVVTNVSGGLITLVNQLTASDVGLVLGHGNGTVCGQSDFIVSEVNLTAGTFTLNYNREVVGETLVFVVTVTKFY